MHTRLDHNDDFVAVVDDAQQAGRKKKEGARRRGGRGVTMQSSRARETRCGGADEEGGR